MTTAMKTRDALPTFTLGLRSLPAGIIPASVRHSRGRLLLLFSVWLTAVALAPAAFAQQAATPLSEPYVSVMTDQLDYAPGTTARISGSGFYPGEGIRFQVLHADGTQDSGADHEPWTVTADPLGGFETTWRVCEDDCVGSHLELTGVGLSSGRLVQTIFTDSAPGPKRFLYTGGHGLNSAKLTTFGGHTFTTIGGSDAAWTNALGGGFGVFDAIIVGEGAPVPSLATRVAIAGYVSAGGRIIVISGHGGSEFQFLNGVFGYSTAVSSACDASEGVAGTLQSAAAGTSFAGGPATLRNLSCTTHFTSASRPASAVLMYGGTTGDLAWAKQSGAGTVVWLGWDYCCGSDSFQNDWYRVLDSALHVELDPDVDGDGVLNGVDNCSGNFNPGQADVDGDAIGDVCDLCPTVASDNNESTACIQVDPANDSCSEAVVQSLRTGLVEGAVTVEGYLTTGPITFTKLDSDPDDGSVRDAISSNLLISRTNARSVYNVSSDQIRWAAGSCAAPTSPFMPTLVDLRRSGYLPDLRLLPGRDTCLDDITTGSSYDIRWNSWSTGGAGGFSYTRIGHVRTEFASASYTNSVLPAGIDISALAAGEYELCVSAVDVLPPPTTVTFSKLDSDPDDGSVRDVISANLQITRASTRGVFNLGTDQVQWAVGSCAARTSAFESDFNSFLINHFRSVNGVFGVENNLPGRDTCLFNLTTNTLYDIRWSSWSCCGAGGFSYTRVGPSAGPATEDCTVFTKTDQSRITINGTCNEPPTANAGGPYSGSEGSAIAMSGASASDPNGDSLTYAWSVDSALCSFNNVSSLNPNLTCSDNDSFTVTLEVRDGVHPAVTSTTSVTVTNAAPVGTLNNNGPVNEASAATMSFSGQSDPSSADTTGGFHYAYSCTNGDLSGATYANSGTSASTTCNYADGPGSPVVKARIIDKNDGYTETTSTVTVTNVKPAVGPLTVAGGTGTACPAGNGVTLDFSFTDPGVNDNLWFVDINWGDGSHTTYSASSQGAQPQQSHNYGAGSFTISVSVKDKDGGTGSNSSAAGAVSHLYNMTGILAPFNADGTSVWKYGSTLPVKVRITDCNGSPVSGLAPKVGTTLQDSSDPSISIDEAASTSAADTTGILRYDPTAGQYIYNFGSKHLSDPSATYYMTVKGMASDGITIVTSPGIVQVKFGLKTK